MARPLRPQWKDRVLVRRRHRTWIGAMVLATVGWAVVWSAIALRRYAPEHAPHPTLVTVLAAVCAAGGLFLAVFTVRAKLVWVWLAGIAILANASLLAAPVLFADELRRAEALEEGGA